MTKDERNNVIRKTRKMAFTKGIAVKTGLPNEGYRGEYIRAEIGSIVGEAYVNCFKHRLALFLGFLDVRVWDMNEPVPIVGVWSKI